MNACTTAEKLREWADFPLRGSHFVPIHQDTLRAIAAELERLHNGIGQQERCAIDEKGRVD